MAAAVTISVYSSMFSENRRRKNREWRSEQSIIGATLKRRPTVDLVSFCSFTVLFTCYSGNSSDILHIRQLRQLVNNNHQFVDAANFHGHIGIHHLLDLVSAGVDV